MNILETVDNLTKDIEDLKDTIKYRLKVRGY